MSRIKASALLALFERMYAEHWAYEWGAAREGCVDCSGAFVYAYKKLGGPTIAHGSNSIARKSVGALHPASKAKPGWAVFKVRNWADTGNSWYGSAPGDVYHIGLMGRDGKVLNAKSTEKGFSADPFSKWQYTAPLTAVDYDERTTKPMEILYNAKVTTKSGTLNLRTSPSTASSKLCEIPHGAIVGIYEESGDWLGVQYGTEVGYASAQYLTREGAEQSAAGGAAVGRIVIRDADGREFYPKGQFTVRYESAKD